jgi:hypothetical protein
MQGTPLEKHAPWKLARLQPSHQPVCKPAKMLDVFPGLVFPHKLTKTWYTGCQHNSEVSMHNRYLRSTEPLQRNKISQSRLAQAKNEFFVEMKKHFQKPLTLNEFLEGKAGGLKRRYYDAVLRVYETGADFVSISTITAFIKKELFSEHKAPRSIMGRDPRFNLIYGLFTTAMEDAMMQMPQVTKGKTPQQMGVLFHTMFGDNIGEGDCSKFEGSIRQFCLEWELDLAKFLLSDDECDIFHACWLAKMRKKGHFLDGTKFEFWFCRGSGDMDTGLFNTMINWILCRYFELENKLGDKRFFVNGDDNMIDLPHTEGLIDTFSWFGFDCKFHVRRDYHDVEYCSGRFIQPSPGRFLYVPKLEKLLSFVFTIRNHQYEYCRGEYYATLGLMYQKMYAGIPVLDNLANLFLASSNQLKTRRFNRRIYEEAFGFKHMDIGEQIPIDPVTALVEMAMVNGMNFRGIEDLMRQLDTTLLALGPATDKRYRKRGTPFTVDTALVDSVEGMLRSAALEFHLAPPLNYVVPLIEFEDDDDELAD